MLNLIKYPVESGSGKVSNTFAGFRPILLDFKREDAQIIDLNQGTDNTINLVFNGNLTADINVFEYVYFYSEGNDFTYNFSAQILGITYSAIPGTTTIRVNEDFIENSTSGYCNYFQDWLLEAKLVNSENTDIVIYKAILGDDGTKEGNVNLDVSIPVDLLSQNYQTEGGEVTEGRIKYQVKFRESYRDNRNNAFILIDEIPIINTFASVQSEIEKFVNVQEVPILWVGYANGISFLHSDSNANNERLLATFDELDINEDILTSDNLIHSFKFSDYGFLFVSTLDIPNFVFNENTKFVKLKIQTGAIPDYNSADYNSNDYFA